MGKIITFHGKFPGKGKTTSAMALIATAMAKETGARIAITQVPGKEQRFDEFFDENLSGTLINDMHMRGGLWALWQRFRRERPMPEDIRCCAIKTKLDNLDLFPFDSVGIEPDDKAKLAVTALILSDLKKAYDYLFVDAGGGEPDDYQKAAMQGGDILVMVLPQSERLWNKAFEGGGGHANKHTMYLINGYLTDAHMTKHRLSSRFCKETGNSKLLCIPFLTEVLDGLDEGKIMNLLKDRNKKSNGLNASLHQCAHSILGEINDDSNH